MTISENPNSLPSSLALRAHQAQTIKFILRNKMMWNCSDAGTGKTRPVLEAFQEYQRNDHIMTRMVVVCPKSVMGAVWGQQIKLFTPELEYTLAYAGKREQAWTTHHDVLIINFDGLKWLGEKLAKIGWSTYTWLVFDESTAFKNPQTRRFKYAKAMAPHFSYRMALTGTPMPQSVLNAWSQLFLLDNGARLGLNYYQYRHRMTSAVTDGQFTRWVDKPRSTQQVFERTKDITVRYALDDVAELPPRVFRDMQVPMSARMRVQYKTLESEAILAVADGTISALNKAVLVGKLLQLCSGAVYTEEGGYSIVNTERYELVLELIREVPHSIVAYSWKHQLETLKQLFYTNSIIFRTIESHHNPKQREDIIYEYQTGAIQTILIHPQSAGHGITLTRARRLIWASPTWSSELFQQTNARLYRYGQQHRTEVIQIAAENSWETLVYRRLSGKIRQEASLLDLFKTHTHEDMNHGSTDEGKETPTAPAGTA